MKRIALIGLLVVLVVCNASAGDAVSPGSVTNLVNTRGEDEATLSGVYFTGTTLLFTNALCLTAAGTTQALNAVTINFDVGNTSTNIPYTGTVYKSGATTNRWWASIEVPDISGSVNLQTKITDESSNVYIYPWKRLSVKDPL